MCLISRKNFINFFVGMKMDYNSRGKNVSLYWTKRTAAESVMHTYKWMFLGDSKINMMTGTTTTTTTHMAKMQNEMFYQLRSEAAAAAATHRIIYLVVASYSWWNKLKNNIWWKCDKDLAHVFCAYARVHMNGNIWERFGTVAGCEECATERILFFHSTVSS